jgi:hypothetical protein
VPERYDRTNIDVVSTNHSYLVSSAESISHGEQHHVPILRRTRERQEHKNIGPRQCVDRILWQWAVGGRREDDKSCLKSCKSTLALHGILSLTRSLKQFDLWLNSTTTATLWAFKSCPVLYTYLMSMKIFFNFLLYRCRS